MKEDAHKQTIWLVIDNGDFGGIETHVYLLAKALSERKQAITVVFMHPCHNQPLAIKLQESNIPTMYCKDVWSFIHYTLKSRPILLHTHGYKPSIVSKIIGLICNLPVLSTYHSGALGPGRVKYYHLLDNRLSFLSTNIAVSASIYNRLQGKRNHLIPNFTSPAKHMDKNKILHKKCAFIGRISTEKGPDYFCKLAHMLPEYTFDMIGDGDMLKSLTSPNNLNLKGALQTSHKTYQDYDLICMPSREEGLPLTALEAMASGTPVVAFAVGGLPSLIKHENNGFLVKPYDLDAFAQCIKTFMHWPKKKQRAMQQAAYHTIQQHYSTEVLLEKAILPLYKKLMKG